MSIIKELMQQFEAYRANSVSALFPESVHITEYEGFELIRELASSLEHNDNVEIESSVKRIIELRDRKELQKFLTDIEIFGVKIILTERVMK